MILTIVGILICVLILFGMVSMLISPSDDYKPEGYHSEAMDSQGGVLWVSDNDSNDSFWG